MFIHLISVYSPPSHYTSSSLRTDIIPFLVYLFTQNNEYLINVKRISNVLHVEWGWITTSLDIFRLSQNVLFTFHLICSPGGKLNSIMKIILLAQNVRIMISKNVDFRNKGDWVIKLWFKMPLIIKNYSTMISHSTIMLQFMVRLWCLDYQH